MNKLRSLLPLLYLLLPACKQEEVAAPLDYESTSVVQLHNSLLVETIDWNRELKILASEEVLAAAALAAGTDPQTLSKAIRSEVKIEDETIHIIATEKDPDQAQSYAQSLANAFIDFRITAEKKLVKKKLDELDQTLLDQSEEVKKRREELSNLVEKYGIPSVDQKGVDSTLEQDRMTYEKAKKALEEDPE